MKAMKAMKASTRRTPCAHLRRLAVMVAMAAAVMAIDARAELVDIAWDKAGRFETTLSVAPGKFAEVCGKLAQGQAIAWSFKGDRPMNFNIHYHEGRQVVVPVEQDAAADAQGKLDVSLSQDYCWMWTNKATLSATLLLVLMR